MNSYTTGTLVPQTQVPDSSTVLWSNYLVNAPAAYSLLERRLLYYLTLQVKKRFVEKDLGVPENWKDLYFDMTDADLGQIGGKTHVLQTYEALSKIGEKFMNVLWKNKNGETLQGKIHWIDTFFYESSENRYRVRISPEVIPFLINLSTYFTAFNAETAMLLQSKYAQKFYEICCEFLDDFRYRDSDIEKQGLQYKKNVLPIKIDTLRNLFNLNEIKDGTDRKNDTKIEI